jgi:hypothetical protein
MAPNSWDIDAALIGLLQADAQLAALCPDGVFYDVGPPNVTRFVTVSLIDPVDLEVYDGRALEDNLYQVKAVGLSTALTVAQTKAAAYRIDQVLHDQALTIPGYVGAVVFRDRTRSRIRYDETNPQDPSLRFHHGGGWYRVHASVADPVMAAKPAPAPPALTPKE